MNPARLMAALLLALSVVLSSGADAAGEQLPTVRDVVLERGPDAVGSRTGDAVDPDGDRWDAAAKRYARGDVAGAVTTLRAMANDAQRASGAALELGRIYGESGAWTQARDAFRRAAGDERTTTRAAALLGLAQSESQLGAAERAAVALDDLEATATRLELVERCALMLSAQRVRLSWQTERGVQRADRRLRGLTECGPTHPTLAVEWLGLTAQAREGVADHGAAAAGYRQAVLLAQRHGDAVGEFRWEYALGRLLHAQDRHEPALAAYERALAIRTRARGSPDFLALTAPVEGTTRIYYDTVDLLLRSQPGPADARRRRAQRLLEDLRAAELTAHLADNCTVPRLSIPADAVAPGSVVLYPVLLDDRIELLVSSAGGIHQATVNGVGRDGVRQQVEALRDALTDLADLDELLPPAEALYDLLIAPIEPWLRDANTLVVVPDGALGLISLAALHDGRQFLVERLAVVTSPGLTLIDPRPLRANRTQPFLGGVSDGVQGFPPLPAVADEIAALAKQLPDGLVLTNQDFARQRVTETLAGGKHSIVHFATHGYFDRQFSHSFVLAHDAPITLPALADALAQRAPGDVVEMLVLSACQTADGDERAALGLAGAAVRAGARSVLATLWQVSDAATSQLMQDVYRDVLERGATKAQALQHAQLRLLNSRRFSHPGDWAAYVLLGNWL